MQKIEIGLDEIAIIWSVEDVMQQCDWLTKEEALDVLQDIEHNHDANIGVNWHFIEYRAYMRYPPEEADDVEV
jgi:hypothetical protein